MLLDLDFILKEIMEIKTVITETGVWGSHSASYQPGCRLRLQGSVLSAAQNLTASRKAQMSLLSLKQSTFCFVLFCF